MNNSAKKRLVVIGGGAAGFFCAVNAARMQPQLEVLLLEKSDKLLSKVKISGGGRCNVTHACFSISDMIRKYPRGASFLKKAFQQFFTTDCIDWFTKRGVPLKTEADGRMFPQSNSSQSVIDCLLQEASKYNVQVKVKTAVKEINSIHNTATGQQTFTLTLANGNELHADYVCIACGGFPKESQFNWLVQTGHTIVPPVPSLFSLNIPGNSITTLMGISVPDASVKIVGSKLQQSGPLLITHWGLSGPAALKLSAWAARELADKNYNFQVHVNWLPTYNENSLIQKLQDLRFDIAKQKMINRNPLGLPSRLWEYFLVQAGIAQDMRWADLPSKEQNKLVKLICAHELDVKGKTTFKEEFVTAGGILTEEIAVNSMESKKVPNLFFAGEILNVDGVTGGFNFQNAWTTGWVAAQAIATKAGVQ